MGDSIKAYEDRLEEARWKEREKEIQALLKHWSKHPGEFDVLIELCADGIEKVQSDAIGDRNLHEEIDLLQANFQRLTSLPEKKAGKK